MSTEITTEDTKALASAIKKAGELGKPMTGFQGVPQFVNESTVNRLKEHLQSGEPLQFRGIQAITLDPELAMNKNITTLMQLEMKTGLAVPGNQLEVLQYQPQYKVTKVAESPKDKKSNKLRIFYLEEVMENENEVMENEGGL